MRKTSVSTHQKLSSHEYQKDGRFTETFKQIKSKNFTHFAKVSRNGNCFFSSLIVSLLYCNKKLKINMEKCKENFRSLGLEEFVWEDYCDKMEEFMTERSKLRKTLLEGVSKTEITHKNSSASTLINEEIILNSVHTEKDSNNQNEMERTDTQEPLNDTTQSLQSDNDLKYVGGDEINKKTSQSEDPQTTGLKKEDCKKQWEEPNQAKDSNIENQRSEVKIIETAKEEEIKIPSETMKSQKEEQNQLKKVSTTQELIEEIDETSIPENEEFADLDTNELIMFFKLVLSSEFTLNQEIYQPFLEKPIIEYIKTSIQPMFKNTDIVDITGISRALGIEVHVFGIEGVYERIEVQEDSQKLLITDNSDEIIKIGLLNCFDHFEPLLSIDSVN